MLESYFGSHNSDHRRVGIANILHAMSLLNPVGQKLSQFEVFLV